jgi:anaerobic magnesium-protoporphyrin IX monomethyl ester cyclase
MMKVLFVYTRETPQSPDKPLVDLEAIQFGISYISAYLKAHGHQTRLLVMTRQSDFSEIDRLMTQFDPQLVCCTAVATEYLFVEKIARHIRKGYPGRYLVLGGVHASLQPAEVMFDTFDALCIGEGEQPMLELVEQLHRHAEPAGIANLWINREGGIEKNPPRDFCEDLDSLPFADRQIWDEWIDFARSPLRPSLLLGRGCPFLCTYCCNHSLRKMAGGRYVRLRSPENVVAEIDTILKKMPKVREIYFEVETFGANLEWATALCDALERFNAGREQPLAFSANLRVTPALKSKLAELFSSLRKANFRSLNIGLESGSPRLRSEVLHRHYANDDIIQAVADARKYGLQVIFFNLIGLPTETIEDLNQTIEVNRICQPDYHYLSIFYPYPGTKLHTLCETSGWLPRDLLASSQERVRAALDYPTLHRGQIQKAFAWFDAYVFGDTRPRSWHIERLFYMYQLIYGKGPRLWWALTLDVLRPSLRIRPGTPEIRLGLSLLQMSMAGRVYRKGVSLIRGSTGKLRRNGVSLARRSAGKVRRKGVSLVRRSVGFARRLVATAMRSATYSSPDGNKRE